MLVSCRIALGVVERSAIPTAAKTHPRAHPSCSAGRYRRFDAIDPQAADTRNMPLHNVRERQWVTPGPPVLDRNARLKDLEPGETDADPGVKSLDENYSLELRDPEDRHGDYLFQLKKYFDSDPIRKIGGETASFKCLIASLSSSFDKL
jgi:hypothetical protein